MKTNDKCGIMFQLFRRVAAGALPAVLVIGLLLTSVGPALAANPTFAIVGPAEWDLPITPSANVFMQTGVYQSNTRKCEADGTIKDITGTHTFIGITRFAHLFSFKSMPKVGFFWEALLPEIRIEGTGKAASGIGDPLFDFGVYYRPFRNSPVHTLVGFQNILSIPVGASQVTNNYWVEYPTFITDASYGKLGFDATLGAGFPTEFHKSGEADRTIGKTYFAEAALRYQVLPWLTPFVQYNYQKNESGHIHDPNNTPLPSCREDLVGGGLKINFTHNRWLSLWYNRGISGANTVQTDAVYLRFVNIFG